MFHEIKNFASYLLGKRSEIEDMDMKDVVMAKAIFDIHRTRTHKKIVAVPLFSLRQIHRLDRENALQATEKRVQTLQDNKTDLLQAHVLSCEILGTYLPSVSWIKVVQEDANSYLAFEGNGRLAALQSVFDPEDGIEVEVELYCFRNPHTVLRGLNRVRRMNGLLPDPKSPERPSQHKETRS